MFEFAHEMLAQPLGTNVFDAGGDGVGAVHATRSYPKRSKSIGSSAVTAASVSHDPPNASRISLALARP